jgi:hypothetical protein
VLSGEAERRGRRPGACHRHPEGVRVEAVRFAVELSSARSLR